MSPPESEPAPPARPERAEERLSSWKEIAAYLGRDVRTVQRWERTQGLPVHRHRHNRLSTAYALKSELDAWWHHRTEPNKGEAEEPEPIDAEPPARGPSTLARAWLPALAATVLLVAGLLAYLIWGGGGGTATAASSLAFKPRDWVLVTALENTTGRTVFDSTIEYVMRQELARSAVLQVASPDRVRDALILMRRPTDTRVDVVLGREVSLRDGGIRALVAIRVDPMGSRLRLSADIVAPADGRIVATSAREVDDEGGVLDAVVSQATWVRRTLGESALNLPSAPQYPQVTTSSLPALQLYAKAVDLGLQFQWAPATRLLETAIQYDPQFASAHILLAWALVNTGGLPEAVLAAAARARELAPHSTEAERYFIEGSDLTLRAGVAGADRAYGLFADAAAAYEALLQIEPAHYWGALNLMTHYETLQRFDKAVPLAVAMAAARPNDVPLQVRAARALVSFKGDVGGATVYVERAKALLASGAIARPVELSWIDLFDPHRAWAEGDVEQARRVTDRVAATLPARMGTAQDEYARRVGAAYAALGRCSDARAAFEQASANLRHEALAMLSWECDDPAGLATHMVADARTSTDPSYFRVMWGARSGDVAQAERWIDDFRKQHPNRIVLAVADGELAAARGEWDTAIGRLGQAWSWLKGTGQERTCRVAEQLARAYREVGRTDQALQVLEATIPMRPRMFDILGTQGGLAWIRAQLALADLYRELGRTADADRVTDAVRPLLREADPDLPLLARLTNAREADRPRQ